MVHLSLSPVVLGELVSPERTVMLLGASLVDLEKHLTVSKSKLEIQETKTR